MSTLTPDAPQAERATRTYPSYSRNLLARLLLNREAAVILALVVVFVYAMGNVQYFDGPLTIYNLLKEYAPILLMALPMTLIIVTGEIDLSVASTLGASAAITGVLVVEHDLSVPTAALVAIAAGAALGALNGFFVAYVGLPSLAVTIGSLALYRGLAQGLIQDKRISGFPGDWRSWPTERIGDTQYPNIIIPIVVLAVVFGLLLHFTGFGRSIFEIGLSDEAAHFAGVNVARTKLILFTLSGAVAAFAGVYVALKANSVATDTGTGFELKVIAGVLLGGVSIFGGRGALHGVIAGVLLIAVLNSALQLDGQGSEVIQIIIGLLLVGSVIASNFLPRIRALLPRRAVADAATPKTPVNGDHTRKVAQ
ncbi:ABC transporter permease [Nocardioides humi]|uniref:Autoinducer 2 import system permease protein LsrD n=1 Tax=Nocardioides humi TaxID=449461 RepID=A0ABN2AD79_9ACTN|nr:ABC transporter permease [Nocardioides humi]